MKTTKAETPLQLMERVIERINPQPKISIVERIAELIATDDCDQSDRLIAEYKAASPKRREAIDSAFLCLCGYQLKTLIDEHEREHDDAD